MKLAIFLFLIEHYWSVVQRRSVPIIGNSMESPSFKEKKIMNFNGAYVLCGKYYRTWKKFIKVSLILSCVRYLIFLHNLLFCPLIKGTVSRDLDGLSEVWMDRALFWRWTSDLLNLSVASWFLTLNFAFFRGAAQKLPVYKLLGQPSFKCIRGC
jgi:hypothetical protein